MTTLRDLRTSAAICLLALFLASCGMFVSVDQQVERATAYRKAGDFRAAAIELKNALKREPGNVRARFMLAENSLALADGAGALREAELAVSAGLELRAAAPVMSEALLASGQYEELLKRIGDNRLPLAQPARSIAAAEAYIALGKLDEAEREVQQALAADAASPDARTLLAQIGAARGGVKEAMEELGRVVESHPTAYGAFLTRALILLSEGRYAEAQADFDKALSGNPASLPVGKRYSAITGKMIVAMAQGHFDEAAKSLERARALAPNAVNTILLQARLMLAKQDYANAISVLQGLVTQAPDLTNARFLLGTALLSHGNPEQAEFHLARVVNEAPENTEARKVLARARLQQSRPEAALQVLEPLLDSRAPDSEVAALASAASRRSGDYSIVLDALEKRVRDRPDDLDAKTELAAALIVSGQRDRALQMLQALPVGKRTTPLMVEALARQSAPADARRELDKLVAANPRDAQVLSFAARFELQSGQTRAARSLVERALEIDARSLAALLTLAQVELAEARFDAAKSVLTRASELQPKASGIQMALAAVFWQSGDHAQAISTLDTVLRDDPSAVRPASMLARLHFMDRDPKRAEAVLAKLVEVAPNRAEARTEAGLVLLDYGRYEPALAYFRGAAEIEPRNPTHWVNSAQAQIALEQWAGARESIGSALAADPSHLLAASYAVLLDLREGKREAALARAVELRKAHPKNPSAAILEGDVRSRLGQHADAARAYEDAARLQPSLAVAARLTETRRSAGLRDPEVPLVEWVRAHPEDRAARTLLAETYRTMNRGTLALAEYERLAAMNNASPAVLNNLAWLYHQSGDPRAESIARKAYDGAKGNGAIADTLGWILLGGGKVGEATRILQEAAAALPQSPEVRYHYAAALAKGGKTTEAAAELERALQEGARFAERPEAEKLRAQLQR